MRVKANKEQVQAKHLVENLASKGRYYFSSEEARTALNVSAAASKLALNRLIKRGQIASPARGFYVIVPPEYRSLGCLPADQFVPGLMEEKGLTYYAGLLTAAQYYGAAHQRPQEFQVFVQKNRRSIQCGKVRAKFIAKKNINNVPVQLFNTLRGEVHVSTPEATAVDLAGYPQHVGGLDQVATVLSELADEINPSRLVEAAKTAPITWSQRLGYLLEFVEAGSVVEQLKEYVSEYAREYRQLVPCHKDRYKNSHKDDHKEKDTQRLTDWKLIVNVELEPDL